ncbi:MAG: alpha/beta hydrolase [Sulfurimonas sp.]|nr:MAG: alpha/beta hydrolase [Sulfurimonas sp.]
MRYFSGFSLVDDQKFFTAYLVDSEYTVSGFSYGAIKAFEYVRHTNRRIDRLQLFSPAFFQNRDVRFKRLQLLGFCKDADAYVQQFTSNCCAPFKCKNITIKKGSYEALQELLEYVWDRDALEALCRRGVILEMYFGSEDAIVDVAAAKAFFQPFGTTFFINGASHLLQREECV